MEKNYVAPAIDLTAFHCPYCGTKAPQKWLDCYAQSVEKVPYIYEVAECEELIENCKKEKDKDKIPSKEVFERWMKDATQAEAGDLLFKALDDSKYCSYELRNIFFSVCQEKSCGKAALWIHNRLVIPSSYIEEAPNEDMPDNIKAIYNEAREIYKGSPRASAALLRLCCEMLCNHLGAEGKDLNEKIGDLVRKGMDGRIQKALDVVRFIGNKSVHPGQIDLRDDQATSHSLFLLLNEIAQEMISKPKRLDGLYTEKLPEKVRDAISKRDANAKTGT